MKSEEEMMAIYAASDLLNTVLKPGSKFIPIEMICEIYMQKFWDLFLIYN